MTPPASFIAATLAFVAAAAASILLMDYHSDSGHAARCAKDGGTWHASERVCFVYTKPKPQPETIHRTWRNAKCTPYAIAGESSSYGPATTRPTGCDTVSM